VAERKRNNKHGMTYLSDRAIKIIHDDIEYLTNRDKSKLPKKSKFWCIYCDAQLVGEWGKCPNCGKRNGRKRRKK